MHFKNFSLYSPDDETFELTPAYDLVSTLLVMPEDKEELALNLNGKKTMKRVDFETAMLSSGMNEKVVQNLFKRFQKVYPKWEARIRQSFLSEDQQEAYWQLILHRVELLGIK